MSLDFYCCDDLGEHEVICNRDRRKGGISAYALIKTDQVTITDWTDPDEWNAAIANGDATIIEQIIAEYPEVTPIETESLIGCGPDTDLDGFTNVLNIQDGNVTESNDRFYENANTCKWHLVYFDCQDGGTDKIWVVEENKVTIVAKPPVIEKGSQTVQKYMVTATWNSKADQFPMEYDAPTGIFVT